MAKQYENDFKVMIVELLKSGRKAKEVSNEYDINEGVIRRWKREYEVKLGDFSKKREVSKEERMQQRFAEMDGNGDGQVDINEYKVFLENVEKKGKKRMRRRH